jgi:hypothetical protein
VGQAGVAFHKRRALHSCILPRVVLLFANAALVFRTLSLLLFSADRSTMRLSFLTPGITPRLPVIVCALPHALVWRRCSQLPRSV